MLATGTQQMPAPALGYFKERYMRNISDVIR